ncbi:protein DOG1-like 3 [Phoenix dactylifera]|uniref:Protein DOG1-like 3 n=1 Tax=Phoenix dactylifera TaxID=42345 RepID=A0A8B8J4G3_PHODC|nr:protein DOG1-like 3 [Phoenix dactylifera]
MDSRFHSCFEEWVREQESDLNELQEVMQSERRENDAQLRELVEKSMRHYKEYSDKRRLLAREDGPTIFCPPWCTAFENSFLWLGGCRPTLSIRLLYAISGYELEAHLDDLLAPGGAAASIRRGLVGLSPAQLTTVNDLHCQTLKEEDRLSSKMATLQEDVADKPLLPIATDRASRRAERAEGNGGHGVVEAAMNVYAEKLAGMVEEADMLRVATLRTLVVEILTPLQAVELLVAAKQLHLSVRQWGQRRDLHRRQRG